MLFLTPILEYIKIRPSPISKLSPDASVSRFISAKSFPFYLVSLSLLLRKAFPVLSGESLSFIAQTVSRFIW